MRFTTLKFNVDKEDTKRHLLEILIYDIDISASIKTTLSKHMTLTFQELYIISIKGILKFRIYTFEFCSYSLF